VLEYKKIDHRASDFFDYNIDIAAKYLTLNKIGYVMMTTATSHNYKKQARKKRF